MTFFIKLEMIDLFKKDVFYKKIYYRLNSNYNYSGIIIINYLDNTKDEFYIIYNNNISIIMSFLNNKSECSIEYLYCFVRSIINESNKDILNIELKFTKKE